MELDSISLLLIDYLSIITYYCFVVIIKEWISVYEISSLQERFRLATHQSDAHKLEPHVFDNRGNDLGHSAVHRGFGDQV